MKVESWFIIFLFTVTHGWWLYHFYIMLLCIAKLFIFGTIHYTTLQGCNSWRGCYLLPWIADFSKNTLLVDTWREETLRITVKLLLYICSVTFFNFIKIFNIILRAKLILLNIMGVCFKHYSSIEFVIKSPRMVWS